MLILIWQRDSSGTYATSTQVNVFVAISCCSTAHIIKASLVGICQAPQIKQIMCNFLPFHFKEQFEAIQHAKISHAGN